MVDMPLNVLFLDDESMVLQALQRSLRPQKGWNMHFCTTIEQFNAFLESEPVDVVVTDMQMPDIDGESVLSLVREQKPETVRFVLSGFKDRDAAIRTSSAHRFLMKPILVTQFIHHIEQAIAGSPDAPAQRRLVNGTTAILSNRKTVDDMRLMLSDRNASTLDVATLVQSDPGISAKLLQLGNSGVFGTRPAGVSLVACVQAIGLDSLRVYARSDDFVRTLPADDPRCEKIDALAGRARIAASDAPAGDDAAQMAGLLHVVGALLALDGDSATIDDDDRDLGADLLQVWGIPSDIIERVRETGH